MDKFVFHNPTKLIFGKGQLESLRTEVPAYGKKCCWFTAAAASNAAVCTIK
ncbi:hypothetical protein HMSSN139_40870 [Paenibacillus sp. HMSSN-139]|nr:hypothetical protein HMSSN139_40870 [Paenibacillus sp. HMSSN-139]